MYIDLRRYHSHKIVRSKNRLNKLYKEHERIEHKTSEDIGKVRGDLFKQKKNTFSMAALKKKKRMEGTKILKKY